MPYLNTDQTQPQDRPTVVVRSRVMIGRPGKYRGPYRVTGSAPSPNTQLIDGYAARRQPPPRF